jgi:Leishmanolysin
MRCTRTIAKPDGECVTRMVLPASKRAAQAFFGCDALPGLELENDDTGECRLVGSHLESRISLADMINPFLTGLESGITILSLAVLSDSG